MTTHSAHRARLTRAINSRDPRNVINACTAAVQAWQATGWPDDWERWQNALDDIAPIGQWHRILLDDLI